MKKYIKTLLVALMLISTAGFCQDAPLWQKDGLQIEASRAVFQGNVIYDADKELAQLRAKEASNDCPVDYAFAYHPLSLVGDYYSYGKAEGGSLACGTMGSSVSVQTIDVTTGKTVAITDLFTPSSVLKALKADHWVQRIATEHAIDLSLYNDPHSLIEAINQQAYLNFGQRGFSLSSFAVLDYQPTSNQASIRWVAEQARGFNHHRHLQLGLTLTPKPLFRSQLINDTHFLLGTYINKLSQ